MADQSERILKDINRHLAHIDEKDGMADRLTSTETATLNKNANEVIGNFSSLISAETKDLINSGNKQLIEAFGNLKGFDTDAQADLLDEVVDELQTNNRFMAKSEHNDFLAEAEREQDLNINRRTNDLLEDLVDKEDDAAAAAKAEASATSGFLSGGMGGLFGGLFAGKSIKGHFGALKGAGKKVFFPLLLAGAGAEFLRGWAEAGTDASVRDKFSSGIGRLASDLTLGLVSKEFFQDAMIGIENAIVRAWTSFTDNWNKFVSGKISSPDFFANLLSDLTMGALSPEQLKGIGSQIEAGMSDLVDTVVGAIVDGFISPTFDAISEKLTEILDDPIAFAKKKFDEFRERQKEDAQNVLKRAQELMETEGLSEKSAIQQATLEKSIEQQGFIGRMTGRGALGLMKKFGAFSETQEEAAAKEAEKQAKAELKAKRAEERRIRLDKAKRERLAFREEIEAEQKEKSKVGQEGLKEKIAIERALTNFKRNQEQAGGNAMQINQNNMVSAPVDRQTENDDLNLQRSSYAE